MNAEPLVSICCAAYNQERFIADAIHGFLAQVVDFPIEILINDDASTDATPDILRHYEARYPDLIRVTYQKENQYSRGVRPIVNVLWPQVRGKFVALCEGDDYWNDPHKLQRQIDVLRANPSVVACFTNAIVDNLLTSSQEPYFSDMEEGVVAPEKLVLAAGKAYPTASLVFRFDNPDYKLFDGLPQLNGDAIIIYLLVTRGRVYYMDQVTCVYRRWAGGVASSLLFHPEAAVAQKKRAVEGYRRLYTLDRGPLRRLIRKKLSRDSLYVLRHSAVSNNFRYMAALTLPDMLRLAIYKPYDALRRLRGAITRQSPGAE